VPRCPDPGRPGSAAAAPSPEGRRPAGHDARGLALVIRKPVQDQVFLAGEIPREGRLGDLGRRGDVVDRDLVEAVRQEQRDRRVGDGIAGSRLAGIPDVRVRSLGWRSSYRVNIRMVDQLRVGRVFLAGDAAHVHPIAGGLGMNSAQRGRHRHRQSPSCRARRPRG